MNNGYGETVKGFSVDVCVSLDTIKQVWSKPIGDEEFEEELENLVEHTNFCWTVNSSEEGKKLFSTLSENGFVVDEIEDYIIGVGYDRNKVIEEMLKLV